MTAKRSRLDRKAAAKDAVAKGSTGDEAVKGLLQQLGWAQVADLARTYSGADLLAVCSCEAKHLLWVEVKTYRLGKIEADSWQHLSDRAQEVTARPREAFALFTYQKKPGGRKRVSEWWASKYSGLPSWADNHTPFITAKSHYSPPCTGGLPITAKVTVPASPRAESRVEDREHERKHDARELHEVGATPVGTRSRDSGSQGPDGTAGGRLLAQDRLEGQVAARPAIEEE